MTYFLARIAGVSAQEAYTIALAAQFIDNNPDTWPLDEASPLSNALNPNATRRLRSYHFTQAGNDRLPTASEVTITPGYWYFAPPFGLQYHPEVRTFSQGYIESRIVNPWNSQLSRLNAASSAAPTRCARAQLFGEFLHAFQDTYAHRSQQNTPIEINANAGHLLYGHEPDKTYDENVTTLESAIFPLSLGNWNQRERRTLQMERETYARLRAFAGSSSGRSVSIESQIEFLRLWNRTRDEGSKILMLDEQLTLLGLGPLPAYDRICAEAKRREYLQDLRPVAYPGVILPTTERVEVGAAQRSCGG
jgi:hypothetical protein